MPSKIDSTRPFYPFRVYVVYPLIGGVVGYLFAAGALDSSTTQTTPSVCTNTTTVTTTSRR